MGHLFSSGEVLYKKNEKDLREGLLVGTALEYGEVKPDTRYVCIGTIEGKPVKVEFTLAEEEYDGIKSRYMFKILMQSDLLLAKWKDYEIQSI
jgi:hypothetical protein